MDLLLLLLRGAWRRHIHAAVPGGLGVAGAGAPAGDHLGRCCAGPPAGAPAVHLATRAASCTCMAEAHLTPPAHVILRAMRRLILGCSFAEQLKLPNQGRCCRCMPPIFTGLTVIPLSCWSSAKQTLPEVRVETARDNYTLRACFCAWQTFFWTHAPKALKVGHRRFPG